MNKQTNLIIVLLAVVWCFAGSASDSKVTISELKAKAEKGDPEAQERLGDAYALGAGVSEDQDEATIWIRKAAEHGYPSAQWSLGSRAWKGQGMPKDLIEATKWLKLAALVGYENRYASATQTLADVIREMTPEQKIKAGVENLIYLPPPKSKDVTYRVNDRKLLEGVKGISVIVDVQDEAGEGIKDRLQTMVELRLRTAGIKVQSDSTFAPTFVLRLHTLHYEHGLALFSVIGVLEDFATYNKLPIVDMQLWNHSGLYYVGSNLYEQSALSNAQAIVDHFANDYLAANPKR